MNLKDSIKPNLLMILIFVFVAIISLVFTKKSSCGVSFFFSFCFKAYGYPLHYLITGDVDNGHVQTLSFGKYFKKFSNILFNPIAFILDIILIYLLSFSIGFCSRIFYVMKNVKHKKQR